MTKSIEDKIQVRIDELEAEIKLNMATYNERDQQIARLEVGQGFSDLARALRNERGDAALLIAKCQLAIDELKALL